MQITLKPLHLAFIGFTAGAVLIIILVLALSGGGDQDGNVSAVLDATATQPAPEATESAPTATSPAATTTKPAPTATKPPPTSTPPPPAPAPAQPTTPPAAPDETEAERQYRVRADGQLLAKVSAVNAANASASTVGTFLAIKAMGQQGAAFANQLRSWEPVPTRFSEVHDGLIAALDAFHAYSITIDSITTSGVIDPEAFETWVPGFNPAIQNVNAAIFIFNSTVGTSVPALN